MNRDSLIDPQSAQDTAEPATAEDADHGLPPAIHARLMMLGPGDDAALSELLMSHRALSSQILADASRHMGLAAVQRAIAATQAAAAGGPSPHLVAAARSYNRAHRHYAAVFNAATDSSCVGGDGQLDPAAVWQWQKDHGIPHDGRVGPQTSATARAASAKTRPAPPAATPAADAEGIPDERMPDVTLPAPGETLAADAEGIPSERTSISTPLAVDAERIPSERLPSTASPTVAPPVTPATAPPAVEAAPPAPAAATDAEGIPDERSPSATPAAAAPQVEAAPAPAPTASPDVAGSGGAVPDATSVPTTTPAPPARPDNGGPGSLARRTLAAQGTADQAFQYLVSDNDAVLDKNLADYGDVAAQRALLDGVIVEGANVAHVRRAFHAYWHIALLGVAATPKDSARDWPVTSLQAIHHQLKLLPDEDARSGMWKNLAWTRTQGGAARGWWDDKDTILLGTDAWNRTDIERASGYFEQLAAPAKAGDTTLHVRGGERLKAGDNIAIDREKAPHELNTVKTVTGDVYTLGTALANDHQASAVVDLAAAGGLREMSWLDYTVRHEIAHSLDGRAINTKGFHALGGWGGGQFSDWSGAMGGDAWKMNDNKVVTGEDRTTIGAGLDYALKQGQSPFDVFRTWDPPHPIMKYEHKEVPVINAALKALRQGESFYESPMQLYAANGKRFSYSFMYKQFQYCSETAVADRVSNYALNAPAEFFAEAYATFYEEAGKPGITDTDYGRLIRSSDLRQWLRDHVHDRGHGPAGTGAAKSADGASADAKAQGAHPDGGNRGRASGVSGL